VPWAELPAHYAAADVFAMPCRTRGLGLDVEGLGLVFLEAAAAGLPVVAGRSGGAPETVQEGRTGTVVDGRDVAEVATAVTGLLADPKRAARMGADGRRWVTRAWNWDASAERLAGLLSG
jgi:phosphatidylinositol alpha-1,6-mannosyltransferase